MNRFKFSPVVKQQLLRRVRQHPWLLALPITAIPLLGFLMIGDARQSQPQTQAVPDVPALPSPLATTPQPRQPLGPPLPAPQKTPQPTQSAKPKASSQPAASAPAARSANVNRPRPVAPKPSSTGVDKVVEMRVAIAQGTNSVAIATSTTGELLDANGKRLRQLPAMTAYTTQFDGQAINFGEWETPAAVWVQPTQGGLVFVGDRWYRGRVLLMAQGSNLLAVNFINLRDYLCSVVGAEMSPSWYLEALKAQAVAARSYAMTFYFRPASDLYHLGNTEAYQVYAGVDKEANTTCQAVDSTSGQFLSYQGGIVESLYAASDDIVIEAHGGRGMSQTGAYNMAAQGYDYLHILGTYYPGTGLGRFEAQK